jgi:hypothetical protein
MVFFEYVGVDAALEARHANLKRVARIALT